VARYEFTIDLPIYLPQMAIDELKTRLKDRMKELVAKCGEYQVDLEVSMKVMPSAEEKSKEEEEEEEV
jgi:predicted nucleic acid-binding protein